MKLSDLKWQDWFTFAASVFLIVTSVYLIFSTSGFWVPAGFVVIALLSVATLALNVHLVQRRVSRAETTV